MIPLGELERLCAEVSGWMPDLPWASSRHVHPATVGFVIGADGTEEWTPSPVEAFQDACDPLTVATLTRAANNLREVIDACAPVVEALLAVHGDAKYISPESVDRLRGASRALREGAAALAVGWWVL